MLFISSELSKQTLEALHDLLEGRLSSAIASVAAFNMVFSQLAAFSLRASTLVTDQFPIGTSADASTFDWDNITPHSSLQWQKCFKDYQCARLQVPMDWHRNSSEADKTVELAVIKLEATVSVIDSTYGGAVFLNPGGPGGSGVAQVLREGHAIRTYLSAGQDADPATAKNFDIISFDPRGINNTRPLLSCFANHIEAASWEIEKTAQGYIGDTASAFDNLWARMRALGEGCSQRAADLGIGKHMSTAPVARDIVELFEKHGEWREAEAAKLIKANRRLLLTERQLIVDRTAYRRGQEMVQFWGFSYGSALGAHFAAMYPERSSRLVLDGVVDSFDYMAAGWTSNLVETDMAFVKLAEYCWLGGRSNCPLFHDDGPAAIIDHITEILEYFRENPISRPGNATHGPSLITFHDYEVYIRDAVYNLLTGLPELAHIIHELGHGNATTLEAYKASKRPKIDTVLSEACVKDGPFSIACQKETSSRFTWDNTYGIACTDGLPRTQQTKNEYKEYVKTLMEQSRLIGASWSEIMIPCTAWNVRPAWRYEGNFVAKTAHPILFVGNTYDPVTPIRSAFRMVEGFEGARILHQNSEGHCSTASVSMCTAKAIRKYFQTGDLPALDHRYGAAFCEPDILPLSGYKQGSKPELPAGETDAELWNALISLNQQSG